MYEPKPEPQPQPAVLKEEIFHREEPNQLTRVQSPPLQTKSDNRWINLKDQTLKLNCSYKIIERWIHEYFIRRNLREYRESLSR